ncbi:poly-gamma-glutamate synthesis protein (capsule biosynthesis protein) [Cyclonatronum proteinivorum]|uniref:Poly-gamma-glutamate synthesis protein (Capsule biosynthesis protein) n=1 Tax=Cyclonatronum proteinivorum TaxID=1457365 RepID=A0A345UML5_9BACT|nr:CapA family protein [Cyclonatronum proteinivorum]AXJ01717.1 poly-gamma-glutamate synthesis protein (capsule biosynthesis protein) [Cyclonatronum proteinivorum]
MKIALLGDLAFTGVYDLTTHDDAAVRLQPLAGYLSGFDCVLANLESPLTDLRTTRMPKSIHLKSPVQNVSLLKQLGVTAVSLANNHMFDFGKKGCQQTIAALESAGIGWYGLGGERFLFTDPVSGSRISASGFCCFTTHGLGYGPDAGSRPGKMDVLSRANLENRLKADAAEGALSILSVHWGKEHTNYPNFEHLQLAKTLMAEAERPFVIHGHHPHVLQGVLRQHDSLCAFSLGNAVFGDVTSLDGKRVLRQNAENRKSVLLELHLAEGRLVQTKLTGYEDQPEGMRFTETVADEVESYSDFDRLPATPEAWEAMRRAQYEQVILEKFGARTFSWYLSKLTYDALLNKVLAAYRKYRYRRLSRRTA